MLGVYNDYVNTNPNSLLYMICEGLSICSTDTIEQVVKYNTTFNTIILCINITCAESADTRSQGFLCLYTSSMF